MNKDISEALVRLTSQHKRLGIAEQIDYEKFYLYSIITHSTAIEGSTVTEVEAQLLFDEGITSNRRTMNEQLMNLDLKAAYDYGMEWIRGHEDITVDWLCGLSAKVMARTGSEYHSLGGDFSAARGELRKLNVTAGFGGRSYMSYLKVPARLAVFCEELNSRRRSIDANDIAAIYELSFWAHYELVTIHPWADGNGRMARLLMNLLQMEFSVLPTKVLKEDKPEYIQSLIDTREQEDTSIFIDTMARLHCQHLEQDTQNYRASMEDAPAEKRRSTKENREIILAFIAEKGIVTADMVATYIGLKPSRTRDYLKQLVDEGLIQTHGANKNRTYSKIDKQHTNGKD